MNESRSWVCHFIECWEEYKLADREAVEAVGSDIIYDFWTKRTWAGRAFGVFIVPFMFCMFFAMLLIVVTFLFLLSFFAGTFNWFDERTTTEYFRGEDDE